MAQLEVVARALSQGSTSPPTHCAPFRLPAGFIILPDSTLTVRGDTVFTPLCTALTQSHDGPIDGTNIPIKDFKDPFHASITPQAYATGAATVIAWMLVIMLIITPRTFFLGGASGRSGLMGRRGMISGATGGASVIGVGTRPWLQKVAALTVAVSLTVATADTFKIAARQYASGFMNAEKLRYDVVTSTEIKVSRMVSDVFLWLAQVQTLIRLFPRHKEKVLIKWVGFGLILFDIAFSGLNNFGPDEDTRRPLQFTTAIPALNYLFQLSLSMLYAAWVIYYAITKRRYAFFHDMMWNISVVALLSIIAIITPVVFFIIDISNESIAGWGDYFRWVGAAAASVIVWEWVERIEALEREERKDGILGREIYDGDDMLETTPAHDFWPRKRQHSNSTDHEKRNDDGGFGLGGSFATGSLLGFSALGQRLVGLKRHRQKSILPQEERSISIAAPAPARQRPDFNSRPHRQHPDLGQQMQHSVPVVASPVSRTDTTSADSTVYTIRYHPVGDSPPRDNHPPSSEDFSGSTFVGLEPSDSHVETSQATGEINTSQRKTGWNRHVTNLFRRSGRSPPAEVQRGRVIEPLGIDDVSTAIPPRNYAGLALRDRLGTFAAQQGDRFRSKKTSDVHDDSNLPVTIIPHPNGRTWSPEQLASIGQEQTEPLEGVNRTLGTPFRGDVSGSITAGPLKNNSPSATRHAEIQETSGSLDASEASPNTRNSHVRFAPRPAVRYQPDVGRRAPSQSPNAGVLGTEVSHTPQSPPASASIESPGTSHPTRLDGSSTPTNHDR